jgi:hypothetical protein
MKALTIFSIALVIFAAAPVLACGGGSGDKDDDTAAFTSDVQSLCGDSGGDKSDDQTASYLCSKPKPDTEPKPACGGDKGDKGDSEQAALLCGGTCGGGDKDDTEA